jgi:transcriptional regulator with PAS, ATPase and Fis domain
LPYNGVALKQYGENKRHFSPGMAESPTIPRGISLRAALVIESPSISAMPEWNEALCATELLIRDRRDWEALTHEDLTRCRDRVIVANAASASGKAAHLFSWLRNNPVRTRTFGIFPANDLEMIRLGAQVMDDFLLWPVHGEEFRQRLLKLLGPEEEAREELTNKLAMCNFVGKDPVFLNALNRVVQVGTSEAPVLLTGETGTGKELCARAIHHFSPRRTGPFIPVECGALPEQLFESEVFGYLRGAFTGAHTNQKGLVALASGGTLFLDEVDGLTPAIQGKLLRLLQEKTYRALGSNCFSPANVRIVAACNGDLNKLMQEKKFRADLYFRLDVLRIHLPALRERLGDIAVLARRFVDEICDENRIARKLLSPAAVRKLESYHWPGNVRQLQNAIYRAVVMAEGGEVFTSHIDLGGESSECVEGLDFRAGRSQAIARFEADYVRRILEKHNGNVTRAAREAGKERRAFGRLAKKYRAA